MLKLVVSNQLLIITAMLLFLVHCGKSRTMEIIPEPVVDQVSIVSPEVCLDSTLWIFPSNPCIAVKGIKDNSTSKVEYQIVYRLSTFDVEFPLGLSIEMDKEFHNLIKVHTDYGSTLELVSSLPSSIIPKMESSTRMSISYTNRRTTSNHELSSRQKSRIAKYSNEIQNILEKEPKLKIRK